MARLARAALFHPAEVAVVHGINRCVRRCFLCGQDPLTGRNFDHRKRWLEERLVFLAAHFGVDVIGFSILSNHFHLILRSRPDVVAQWSDTDVAEQWLALCPPRRKHTSSPAGPTAAELDTIRNVPARLAEIRSRLSDISWFMRMISEPIARWANKEDETSGRFWQGRFKAVRLCDEAAILACAVYVDLNPIRAGLAKTPEASDFTSAQRRIQSLRARMQQQVGASRPDGWLSPVPLAEATTAPGPQASRFGRRASDKGFLPLSLEEYLTLVDWTGRQLVRGKCGSIPVHLPPLLERAGIASANWLTLVSRFGRLFHRVAGAPHSVSELPRGGRGPSLRPGRAQLLGAR